MKSKQGFLIDIVKTWKPNMEPEFRGFRCGVCQNEISKAWHYMLNSDAYKVTVHICENCQKNTNIEGGLPAPPHRRTGDEEDLPADEAGEYKEFQCDICNAEVKEAWHVWNKEGGRLTETHLCKTCGDKNI